jgi:hypothetical protein
MLLKRILAAVRPVGRRPGRPEYLCRFARKADADRFLDWCDQTGRPVCRVSLMNGEWWIEYGPPTRPSVS